MWNATERPVRGEDGQRHGRWAFPATLCALLLILTVLVAPLATAQEPATQEPATQQPAAQTPAEQAPAAPQTVEETPAAAEAAQGLAGRIEARYLVLPTAEGVVLQPRQEIPGIRTLEVTDGEVRINGEAVSPTILSSWLGDEAAPLLALADLGDESARELLGVTAEAAARAAAEAEEEARRAAEEAETLEEEGGLPPVPPVPPEPRLRTRHSGSTMKFGSSIVIQEDEVASEASAIGGSVTVLGQVRRDTVAVGGDVEVVGEVGGDVTAVFGDVILGPDAVVDGNVVAVGGQVRKAPGARIGGDVNEVGVGGVGAGNFDWDDWAPHDRGDGWIRHWKVKEAYWNLVGAVFLALLACLALLVSRSTVERVAERVSNTSDLLVAGLVGVAVQLLLVPLLIILVLLLIITVVGCLALPLIPFALLALVVAALFGYAGVALRLGRWIAPHFGWKLQGPYVAVLLGVGLIEVWRLIGESLDVFGGPAWFFAAMFIFVGLAVEYVTWSVSLGAILLNLFQGRRGSAGELPPSPAGPALPPAPPTPPGAAEGAPEATAPEAAAPAAAVAPEPEPDSSPPPPEPSVPSEAPAGGDGDAEDGAVKDGAKK